jgi:hypothetical protein
MALSTFAFIGFVVYKFLAYRKKHAYRGNFAHLFKDLFNDKYRLN